jgi:cobalamin biosynthesis protein CobT
MKFHHQSIESKFEMRQVQIIQANTMTIYTFVDILKDHFFMSTLLLLSNETFNSRSTRRERFLSSSRNDDERNDDDDSKNDENESDDDENDENDDVENDEKQTTRREKFVEIFEENKSVFEKKSFDVSFDSESSRDQSDVDVKSRKSEKNADERSADEKKISSSNSFSSSSEFFSFEKKIDSSATSQRCVASESAFDSKFSFDLRRSSRRSLETSIEKEKRSIFNERNVESSLKRRRRSEF